MYLKEFEGAALFAKYGINVPRGVLADERKNVEVFLSENADIEKFVVKAQLLKGKRGKSGGIVFGGRDDLFEKIDDLKKKKIGGDEVDQVLVEEFMEIESELYLSIAIDNFERCPVLIFSSEGGVEIEETAEKNPEKIHKLLMKDVDDVSEDDLKDFFSDIAGLDALHIKSMQQIARNLLKLFHREDAIIAEINPLVITKKEEVVAVDSKVILDDNALYKHPEFQKIEDRGLSDLEIKAHEFGLAYVELEGDIAVIGNGAGLVMATLDSVHEKGGRPANFCDVGGGASREMMQRAMELVLQKESVRALFINIFGGITHCDEIAEGIIEYKKQEAVSVPIVVRMVGTHEDKGRALLKADSIKALKGFDEAVKQAVKAT